MDPNVKLSHVFTVREHRQLGTGNTLSYGGKLYTLAKPTHFQFTAKTVVEVRETLDGSLILWHQGQALELKETEKVQRAKETKKASSAQPRKPAASHPWRAWNQNHSQNNINKQAVQAP